MKKARTIKIIKSGNAQSAQPASPAPAAESKYEKGAHVKAVESWVSEHFERRLMAEKIALKLLCEPRRADKLKDEFPNY